MGSPQIRGEVFVFTTQMAAHFEPVQSLTECHTYETKIALASGNIRFALLNSLAYNNLQFWSGVKLGKIKHCCQETLGLMKQQNHLMLFVILRPFSTTISTLYAEELSATDIIPEDVSAEIEEKLRSS